MRWVADRVMNRRARALLGRLKPHLPETGIAADVGSGTGHNGELIRSETALEVRDFDVADLHWVGPGPVIFEEPRLPAPSGTFDLLLLMFVLQYAESPAALLVELRRLSRGSAIVMQSTYRGWWGRSVLAMREFVWGRLAFRLALLARIITPAECPLRPRQYFTRPQLQEMFASTGFELRALETAEWPGLNVSRDLFVIIPVAHE